MSPAQLEAMRAGREAALLRKAAADREAVRSYRDWVKAESVAYSKVIEARDYFGAAHELVQNLTDAWRDLLAAMPQVPGDSSIAWQS